MNEPRDQPATRGCLRIVEERIELLKGCLNGKQTEERPFLVHTIKNAQKRDAEMLATIDKDITDLKSQIEELELQAAKFRREIGEN